MAQGSGQIGDPNGSLTIHQVDLMVRGLDALAALPGVLARAVTLATQSDAVECVSPQLADLIAAEPALAATLLSVANRRYGPAETPRQALQRVPPSAVRAVVLGMKVMEASRLEAAGGPNLVGLWRHCLASACAAEYLAAETKLAAAELAFCCGLLHDVGKLALCECMPKSYGRAVAMACSRGGEVAEYERKIVGVDHAVVGRRLAEHWHLPPSVRDAIWLAHQPAEAIPASLPHAKLVGLIGLADAVAREQGSDFSGGEQLRRTSDEVARLLGVSTLLAAEAGKRLPELMEGRWRMLDLGRQDADARCREAMARANTELARLHDQARLRLAQTDEGARAFEHIREFFAGLRGDAPVSEVLLGIARAVRQAQDSSSAPQAPLVAYAVTGNGDVLALRADGSAGQTWATLRCAADASGGPADPAAIEGLEDWVDPGDCVHQPLVCRGHWVGGVVLPRAEEQDGPPGALQNLAGALALALAMAQERGRAVEVSEQLAGASQELAAAQRALDEAQAMAAVGEMAAGAAHELNNPLAVISGRAQLMRDKAETDEQRRTWALIAEQAARISETISGLMDFARPAAPNPVRLDVLELLAEARDAFSSSDHPQARATHVDIQIGEEGLSVTGDRAQLRAVFRELLANAATACPPAAAVRMTVEPQEQEAVLVAVRDTGCGMDDRTLQRVFTPFFSSQAAGRRRGLGLPRARRYVESNGGKLWIRSAVGQGTTVYVQLRRA